MTNGGRRIERAWCFGVVGGGGVGVTGKRAFLLPGDAW